MNLIKVHVLEVTRLCFTVLTYKPLYRDSWSAFTYILNLAVAPRSENTVYPAGTATVVVGVVVIVVVVSSCRHIYVMSKNTIHCTRFFLLGYDIKH